MQLRVDWFDLAATILAVPFTLCAGAFGCWVVVMAMMWVYGFGFISLLALTRLFMG